MDILHYLEVTKTKTALVKLILQEKNFYICRYLFYNCTNWFDEQLKIAITFDRLNLFRRNCGFYSESNELSNEIPEEIRFYQ